MEAIRSKLRQIDAELKSFELCGLDEKVGKDGILRFVSEVKKRFGAGLPREYVAILEIVNGVEFNGFVLYGAT